MHTSWIIRLCRAYTSRRLKVNINYTKKGTSWPTFQNISFWEKGLIGKATTCQQAPTVYFSFWAASLNESYGQTGTLFWNTESYGYTDFLPLVFIFGWFWLFKLLSRKRLSLLAIIVLAESALFMTVVMTILLLPNTDSSFELTNILYLLNVLAVEVVVAVTLVLRIVSLRLNLDYSELTVLSASVIELFQDWAELLIGLILEIWDVQALKLAAKFRKQLTLYAPSGLFWEKTSLNTQDAIGWETHAKLFLRSLTRLCGHIDASASKHLYPLTDLLFLSGSREAAAARTGAYEQCLASDLEYAIYANYKHPPLRHLPVSNGPPREPGRFWPNPSLSKHRLLALTSEYGTKLRPDSLRGRHTRIARVRQLFRLDTVGAEFKNPHETFRLLELFERRWASRSAHGNASGGGSLHTPETAELGHLWDSGVPYLTGVFHNNYHVWKNSHIAGEGSFGKNLTGLGARGILRPEELLGAELAWLSPEKQTVADTSEGLNRNRQIPKPWKSGSLGAIGRSDIKLRRTKKLNNWLTFQNPTQRPVGDFKSKKYRVARTFSKHLIRLERKKQDNRLSGAELRKFQYQFFRHRKGRLFRDKPWNHPEVYRDSFSYKTRRGRTNYRDAVQALHRTADFAQVRASRPARTAMADLLHSPTPSRDRGKPIANRYWSQTFRTNYPRKKLSSRTTTPDEAAHIERFKVQRRLERRPAGRPQRLSKYRIRRSRLTLNPLNEFFDDRFRRRRFYRGRAQWRKKKTIKYHKPFTFERYFYYMPKVTAEARLRKVNLQSSDNDKILHFTTNEVYWPGRTREMYGERTPYARSKANQSRYNRAEEYVTILFGKAEVEPWFETRRKHFKRRRRRRRKKIKKYLGYIWTRHRYSYFAKRSPNPTTDATVLRLRRYALRRNNAHLLTARKTRLRVAHSKEALRRLTYEVSQTPYSTSMYGGWLRAISHFRWPIEIPTITQIASLNSLLGYFTLSGRGLARQKRQTAGPPLLARIVAGGPSAILPGVLELFRGIAHTSFIAVSAPIVGRWQGLSVEGVQILRSTARHLTSAVLRLYSYLDLSLPALVISKGLDATKSTIVKTTTLTLNADYHFAYWISQPAHTYITGLVWIMGSREVSQPTPIKSEATSKPISEMLLYTTVEQFRLCLLPVVEMWDASSRLVRWAYRTRPTIGWELLKSQPAPKKSVYSFPSRKVAKLITHISASTSRNGLRVNKKTPTRAKQPKGFWSSQEDSRKVRTGYYNYMWPRFIDRKSMRRKPGRRYRNRSRLTKDRGYFHWLRPAFIRPTLGQRLQENSLMLGRELEKTATGRPIFGIQHALLETISRQHRQLALILPKGANRRIKPNTLQSTLGDVEVLLERAATGQNSRVAGLEIKPLTGRDAESEYARLRASLTSRTVWNDLDSIFKQQLTHKLTELIGITDEDQTYTSWPKPAYKNLISVWNMHQPTKGGQHSSGEIVKEALLAFTQHLIHALPGGGGFTPPAKYNTRDFAPPVECAPNPNKLRTLAKPIPQGSFSDLIYPKRRRKVRRATKTYGYFRLSDTPGTTAWDLSPDSTGNARSLGAFGTARGWTAWTRGFSHLTGPLAHPTKHTGLYLTPPRPLESSLGSLTSQPATLTPITRQFLIPNFTYVRKLESAESWGTKTAGPVLHVDRGALPWDELFDPDSEVYDSTSIPQGMRAFTEEEVRHQPQLAATHTYDAQFGKAGSLPNAKMEWRAALQRRYDQTAPIKGLGVTNSRPPQRTPGDKPTPELRQYKYTNLTANNIDTNLPTLEKSLRAHGLRIAEREVFTTRWKQRGGYNFLDFAPQSPRSKNKYGQDGFRSPRGAEYEDLKYRPVPRYRDRPSADYAARQSTSRTLVTITDRPGLSKQFQIGKRVLSAKHSEQTKIPLRPLVQIAPLHKNPTKKNHQEGEMLGKTFSKPNELLSPTFGGEGPTLPRNTVTPLPTDLELVQSNRVRKAVGVGNRPSRRKGLSVGGVVAANQGHQKPARFLPWDLPPTTQSLTSPNKSVKKYYLKALNSNVSTSAKAPILADADNYTQRLTSERRTEQRFARRVEGDKLRTFARSYGFNHTVTRRHEGGGRDEREAYRSLLNVRDYLTPVGSGWSTPNSDTAIAEPVPGKKRNKIPQAIQLPYRKKNFWSRNQQHYFQHNFGTEHDLTVQGLKASSRAGLIRPQASYLHRGLVRKYLPHPGMRRKYGADTVNLRPSSEKMYQQPGDNSNRTWGARLKRGGLFAFELQARTESARRAIATNPDRGALAYTGRWRDFSRKWSDYSSADGRRYRKRPRSRSIRHDLGNRWMHNSDSRRLDAEAAAKPSWAVPEPDVSNSKYREYKRNTFYGDDIVVSLGTTKYQNNFREALDALRATAHERRSHREYGPPPTMSEPFLRYFRSGTFNDDRMFAEYGRKNIRKFRKLTLPRSKINAEERWEALYGLPEPIAASVKRTLSAGRTAHFEQVPKLTTTTTFSKARYIGLGGVFEESFGSTKSVSPIEEDPDWDSYQARTARKDGIVPYVTLTPTMLTTQDRYVRSKAVSRRAQGEYFSNEYRNLWKFLQRPEVRNGRSGTSGAAFSGAGQATNRPGGVMATQKPTYINRAATQFDTGRVGGPQLPNMSTLPNLSPFQTRPVAMKLRKDRILIRRPAGVWALPTTFGPAFKILDADTTYTWGEGSALDWAKKTSTRSLKAFSDPALIPLQANSLKAHYDNGPYQLHPLGNLPPKSSCKPAEVAGLNSTLLPVIFQIVPNAGTEGTVARLQKYVSKTFHTPELLLAILDPETVREYALWSKEPIPITQMGAQAIVQYDTQLQNQKMTNRGEFALVRVDVTAPNQEMGAEQRTPREITKRPARPTACFIELGASALRPPSTHGIEGSIKEPVFNTITWAFAKLLATYYTPDTVQPDWEQAGSGLEKLVGRLRTTNLICIQFITKSWFKAYANGQKTIFYYLKAIGEGWEALQTLPSTTVRLLSYWQTSAVLRLSWSPGRGSWNTTVQVLRYFCAPRTHHIKYDLKRMALGGELTPTYQQTHFKYFLIVIRPTHLLESSTCIYIPWPVPKYQFLPCA